MKHASFFTGVGGLDLGFERAGIHTVSVSEIDPYANAVLAERFPSAINLGSITEVKAHEIPEAEIWSGGFPCQDLSRAGKRAGFDGRRSSLAFTFIDLMAKRKPRWVVLENVPGLFTSNKGADFGRLLYEMESRGYGVAWRMLDAQHFGIAQRRRRVFIVASLESDRSGQVLFECESGHGHLEASESPRQNPATGAARGFDGLSSGGGQQPTGAAPDPNGNGTPHGVAGRLDNRPEMETPLNETILSFPSRFGSNAQVTEGKAQSFAHSAGAPAVFRKASRARSNDDSETWVEGKIANTINLFDASAYRTTHAILGGTEAADPMLPIGLDSHRYRCCGNGVVAPVAEWIGRRIVAVNAQWEKEA